MVARRTADSADAPVEATAGKRPLPRTNKGRQRAVQLLSIAERLFNSNGYAGTSMDDIARETGLLKGSLYYYIENKEDLLYWIVDDVHEVSWKQLQAASELEGSALDRLLDFAEAQVTYNAEHLTRVAVYHHEWHRLEGERLAEVRARRREYDAAVRLLIEQAQAEGDVASGANPRLLANALLAVVIWPYTWYHEGTLSPADLASFCREFIRSALVGAR